MSTELEPIVDAGALRERVREMYRDVRAGSFMHQLGANRAYDLLGDVALGRKHVLH